MSVRLAREKAFIKQSNRTVECNWWPSARFHSRSEKSYFPCLDRADNRWALRPGCPDDSSSSACPLESRECGYCWAQAAFTERQKRPRLLSLALRGRAARPRGPTTGQSHPDGRHIHARRPFSRGVVVVRGHCRVSHELPPYLRRRRVMPGHTSVTL